MQDIVNEAQNKSSIMGFLRWSYYMTLGWLFQYKKAQLNWEITKAVWAKC
jgi:hypothetical protein